MTLDEARVLQQQIEKRRIISFCISSAICVILFFFLFHFSNILEISNVFLVFPVIAFFIIIKSCNILEFLTQKEFIGEVIGIHTFRTRDRIVKGAGWGHGSNASKAYLASEIIVKNQKGRTIIKTFRNGDVVSKLSEGDEIAILRFIDKQPILIKTHK